MSLLGVPAEMLMFPTDRRFLSGTPNPSLLSGPFAATGAKLISGKAGDAARAEMLDGAQEAALWLPPSCAMVHERAAALRRDRANAFPPLGQVPRANRYNFHQELKSQNLLSLSVGVGHVLAFSQSPLPELLSISNPGTSPSSLGNASLL